METTISLDVMQYSYAVRTIHCLNGEKFAIGVKTIYVLFQAYQRGKIALLAQHIYLPGLRECVKKIREGKSSL